MTDDELVKRLRERIDYNYYNRDGEDAADAIKRLTRERDEALRRRIVYSPDAKALSDRAEAAERKVEKLRDALEFYSNRMTYVARSGMECAITRDHFGDRARAALAETEKTDD